MQKDVFETLSRLTQQTLDNWKKLGETNLKISEKLLQAQVALTTDFVETTKETAGELAATKDPKDVAALQTEWAQAWSEKLLESSRSCAEILSEAGKVYNNLFEETLKAAGNDFAKQAKGKKAA